MKDIDDERYAQALARLPVKDPEKVAMFKRHWDRVIRLSFDEIKARLTAQADSEKDVVEE